MIEASAEPRPALGAARPSAGGLVANDGGTVPRGHPWRRQVPAALRALIDMILRTASWWPAKSSLQNLPAEH